MDNAVRRYQNGCFAYYVTTKAIVLEPFLDSSNKGPLQQKK